MLLALDLRNRSLSLGFFGRGRAGKGEWRSKLRLGLIPGRSADEYALLFKSLAAEAGAGTPGLAVDSVWLSSVVPSLTRVLGRAAFSAFGLSCSLVGPGVKTGVKIRSDVPSEVGSDLICAAAAARELVGGPCVVVDFDAAIAFSAIGRAGDFLGAAIAPGMGFAADSLHGLAALLPEVALAPTGRGEDIGPAIGRSTTQAVRAGIVMGYAGLVTELVRRQREELVAMGEADSLEAVTVLGTGEEEGRELFASLGLGRFVPELVLEGIGIIAGRAGPVAHNLA